MLTVTRKRGEFLLLIDKNTGVLLARIGLAGKNTTTAAKFSVDAMEHILIKRDDFLKELNIKAKAGDECKV